MKPGSINRVTLMGRLGKDPMFHKTTTGKSHCTFSLATDASYTPKDSDKEVSRTDWHNIVVWGRNAENCAEFLKKGSKVYLEGPVRTRSYEAKDGSTRYTTEVIVNIVHFLDRPAESAASNGGFHGEEVPPPSDEDEPII